MSRREIMEPFEHEPTERELEILEEIRKYEMKSPRRIAEALQAREVISGYLTHILDTQPVQSDGARIAEAHSNDMTAILWRRFDSDSINLIERDWQYPNRETMYRLVPYKPRQDQQIDPLAAITGYQVTKLEKELADTEYQSQPSALSELADKLELHFNSQQAKSDIA